MSSDLLRDSLYDLAPKRTFGKKRFEVTLVTSYRGLQIDSSGKVSRTMVKPSLLGEKCCFT